MIKPIILAFAGSLRKDSSNKKLVKIAAQGATEEGAQVILIDLLDYPLPIYNEDIESSTGLPPNALKLKELMNQAHGFIIASPEYNSSISGVLKNLIDWTSRKSTPEETYLSAFIGKVAIIMSASPSPLGGVRGLAHLRNILENINTLVLPQQKTLSCTTETFDENDNLKSKKDQENILALGKKLSQTIQKLAG